MILTCPECGIRYFLPDVQVGRAGRTVKCTSCGHVWRAEAPEPEVPDVDLARQVSPEPEPEPEPPPAFSDPEEEFAAAAQRRAEILRQKKAEAERKQRVAGVITAAVWAGLVAAIAILLALGVVFRIQVVKWWPGMASAYAVLHMSVNASGLLIDKVQAAPAIDQGHRALKVQGVLTNASAGPRAAPAFHVNVLDKDGKVLAQRVIRVPSVSLEVGEARRFQLTVADPPPGSDNVEVTLALPNAPGPGPGPQIAPKDPGKP